MLKLKITGILTLFLIAGCSPHPGTGEWLSTTENNLNITKISVFFTPKVLFYAEGIKEPVMQCGWWALDKKVIEMECVHLSDTEIKEKYQIKSVADGRAELIKEGTVIT
ncbi:MAG: hypothetical protein KAU21_03875, partial [Gammaproteobacteria bacterium]|nr:hypothetical protein [Gammaproteobacteria bacterium]